MKKGFSLMEMIAVIGVIGLITLVTLPAIINQLKERETDVNQATYKLIYDAAELYMEEKPSTFAKITGNTCYVYLDTLVNAGKLKSPIKDATRSEEISLTSYVKSTVNNYREYDSFKLITPNDEEYTSVQEGCN